MKSLFLYILLLPLVLLAQPNPTILAFKAEKLFQEGRLQFSEGNFQAALETFNEVVRLDPDHPMVYEMRAEALYQTGDYQRAIDDYVVAARQHPGNAEIRNSMGVAAANLRMYEAAEAYFYEALQIDPTHRAAKENLEKARRKQQESGGSNSWTFNENDTRPYNGTTRPSSGSGSGSYQPYVPPTYPTDNAGNNTPAPRLEHTYPKEKVLIGKRTDRYIDIDQVKITSTGTQITFTITNISSKAYPLLLDKPTGTRALYLTDRTLQRTYRLRNIRGLTGWPNSPYMLQPGEKSKTFTAEFDRLDDDVFFFHILEGKGQTPGAWNFWDVELKN